MCAGQRCAANCRPAEPNSSGAFSFLPFQKRPYRNQADLRVIPYLSAMVSVCDGQLITIGLVQVTFAKMLLGRPGFLHDLRGVFIPAPVKTRTLEDNTVLGGDCLNAYYGVAQENFRTKSNCAAPCLLLFSRGVFISGKKTLAADLFSHRCVTKTWIKCTKIQ